MCGFRNDSVVYQSECPDFAMTAASLLFQGPCKFLSWSATSEEQLSRWKSDRWRTFAWIWPGLSLLSTRIFLPEKLWRTRIRWVLVPVEKLPRTLTTNITSLSLASSHHQFWGTPSINSSSVWNSSWWTDISAICSGVIIPAAGLTCLEAN